MIQLQNDQGLDELFFFYRFLLDQFIQMFYIELLSHDVELNWSVL